MAIGHGLILGRFVEPVVRLLAHTDALARVQMVRLAEEGGKTAMSNVLAATYAFVGRGESAGLAAGHIVQACYDLRFRHPQPTDRLGGRAAALLRAADSRTWGVLYAASLLVDPSDAEDLTVVPELLADAWRAGGYHLRLGVLQVAERCASTLKGEARAQTVEILQGLAADDIGTSSTLLQAFAAFDLLSAGRSVEDIHDEVRIAVENPDRELAKRMAGGIVASQWEEERIVGPYFEALAALEPQRRRMLLLLALAGSDGDDLGADWMINELAANDGLEDQEVRQALLNFARTGDPGSWHGVQMGVCSHVAALKACARFYAKPPLCGAADHRTGAWATVSELLFWLERQTRDDAPTARIEQLWAVLLGAERGTAGDVLHQLTRADRMGLGGGSAHDRVVADHPSQLRTLVTWSLSHRSQLSSPFRFVDEVGRDRYFVEMLGRVGDAATAQLLHQLADDAALADAVAAAIRAIYERLART